MRTRKDVIILPGHWRRTPGAKRMHLWSPEAKAPADGPLCGARLKRWRTVALPQPAIDSPEHRACTDCMVNAIGGRDYSRPAPTEEQ